MDDLVIPIRYARPETDRDIPPPSYMTDGAAGMDLRAAVTADLVMAPGDISLVPTGFAMAIPPGFEAQIRPRSGLAARHGVTLVNSPGTIDTDYRGEIHLALINLGPEPVTIRRGDRVAQMVIGRVWRASFRVTDRLDDTGRGEGGFGHTGGFSVGAS